MVYKKGCVENINKCYIKKERRKKKRKTLVIKIYVKERMEKDECYI